MKRDSERYSVRKIREYITKFQKGNDFYRLQDLENTSPEDFDLALESIQFSEQIYDKAIKKIKQEKDRHEKEIKNIETKVKLNQKLKGQREIPF